MLIWLCSRARAQTRNERVYMEVKEYTYKAGDYSFSLLNLGCAITSICVPDRNGKIANITLPFVGAVGNPDVILKSTMYYGLTVGRFANRIGGASFKVGDRTVVFEKNDGPNLLHSGSRGIWSRIWNVKHTEDGFLCSIKVSEQDDGFPGDADIRVRFSLSDDGVFRIHYSASCSESCPMNLTNHTYFNLTGDNKNDVLSHVFEINSSKTLEVGKGLIPTGKILDTKGTAWDFSKPKALGKDIEEPELKSANGYDHCLIIDRMGGESFGFTRFAKVYEPQSGRILCAYTDLPAFHLYSGNFLNGECGHNFRHGFCLETEFYPDCVNQVSFPSCIVKPGELFESTTVYHFYTDAPGSDKSEVLG